MTDRRTTGKILPLISSIDDLTTVTFEMTGAIRHAAGEFAANDNDDSRVVDVVPKQFLNGIGVWSAVARLLCERLDRNTTGFASENIPSQAF